MALDSWRCQAQCSPSHAVQPHPLAVRGSHRSRLRHPFSGEGFAGAGLACKTVAASALALAARKKPSADAQETAATSGVRKRAQRAKDQMQYPGAPGEWLYGAKSGIEKLDRCVRAVPGEVTVVDVVPATGVCPGPKGRSGGAAVVLSWVAGIANQADWRFSVFSDYEEPEEVFCELQDYPVSSKCRRNRDPVEQIAWVMGHFRTHKISTDAPLADALEEEEDTSGQGVVLLRAGVAPNEDNYLRRVEAIRLRRIARRMGKHVWVLRLWNHSIDEEDELQAVCDNYLQLRTQATEIGAEISYGSPSREPVLRVRKVRNRSAGEAGFKHVS
eukprot:CAMPEP_0197620640 /NCGR_PEP_ID=MMETSP1338-20131121/1437_1 /TAXON_ID=43686 ORGANISM="Pelagodinium beii, Strain RCC1491" /NCGR_SAMPLE_ID=MMETSP1338 /ASSEMBLY_ACC=CAM_ASM_000754 /LENGTH=329 /DNA_ID=CAMNT_0043189885 /DNA_START=13 /DNA_END=1002 /DNA_ORIENTATION=-